VVAGGVFYSNYIHQEKKSDKERKIERKTLSFLHTKRFDTFILRWVQFRVHPFLINLSLIYINLIDGYALFKKIPKFVPTLVYGQ
jgi:hypothetical protein